MALPVTITGISTAVAPVGPFKLAAGSYSGVAIDTAINPGSGSSIGNATIIATGQTLTNPNASSLVIVSITLSLFKTGTPSDNIYLEVTQTDINGTVLATSGVVAASSVTGTTFAATSSHTFTFASPPTISASATFGVRIWRSGAQSSANFCSVTSQAVASYAGGAIWTYNGTTWATGASDLKVIVNSATTIATDAYYFFGRDGTTATTLQSFKATAPDTSWSSIATKTGFTTAILNIAGYQVGNVIHMLVMDGTASTSVATKYLSFDAATDTFLATTETVSAAAAVAGQAGATVYGGSLVVRSNGNVVTLYNGLQTNTSGTPRARLYYRERTGLNTYGTATRVDDNTALDNTTPVAVLGAANRVHFIWNVGGNSGYRTLSAANAQNTGGSSPSMSMPGDGCSYDRSGTTKVVFISNGVGQTVGRFDSSDNPTPTFSNTNRNEATVPHRVGVDGTDVTIAYRSSADSDIYAIKSTDDGATFGAPVSLFVGTVANADANLSRSSSGSVYQRGSNVVVGYVVNDSGTLKYNEYTVRVNATNYTMPAVTGAFTLTGTDASLVYTPYYAVVPPSALLHCDGGAGSTNIIDSSGNNRAFVVIGSGAIDTSQSVFGGASFKVVSSTSIQSRDSATATALNFGTGDYTFDFWWTPNASAGIYTGIAKFGALSTGGGSFTLIDTTTNNVLRVYSNGAGYVITGGTVPTNNVPHHIAITRASGTARLFLDGVQQGSNWTDTKTYINDFNEPQAGTVGGSPIPSWFDEVRIIVGTAVWTSNFTPPAAPYPNSSSTAKSLATTSGSYSLTRPTTTKLARSRLFAATTGSYTLTGTDALLAHQLKKITALAGAYALTGTAATLTYAPHASYVITATAGAYALTGTAATLTYVPAIPAATALLHFDGTNGSTSIVDSSGNNFIFAVSGAAALDTSTAVFGPSSLHCTGGSVRGNGAAGLNFGTGNYTVDFRFTA